MQKIILMTILSITNAIQAWEWSETLNFFKKAETESFTKEFALQADSQIFITNDTGSITIKSWNQKKIMIEAIKKGKKEQFSKVKINITPTSEKLTISPQFEQGVTNFPIDFIIMVPKHCGQITAIGQKGSIKVKDCPASLELTTENGAISVHNATKSVTAKTNNGSIKLKQSVLSENDSLFLETNNGNVTVRLSPKIHANVRAKTTSGVLTSSVYITLEPLTTKLNKDMWARIKKEATGTIGNGGSPITIDVTRGNIAIDEL